MKHRIVTAAQMKAIEQAGNAHGLPYLQMMENAGLAAYAELKNVLPQPGSLLVVCGNAVDETMKNDIALAARFHKSATTLDGILTVKGQGRRCQNGT